MAAILEYFLIAFVGMFVIINPLTTASVFASLTADIDDEDCEPIARRALFTSTAMLFVFALLGSMIFQLFGITLAAFRIAGGMILFGIAMNMLNKSEASDHGKSEAQPSKAVLAQDIAIVPLSIPFISGPGAIATAMILTSEAPGFWYSIVVLFAIAATTVSCYFAMVYSKHVIRLIGNSGRRIMTKIFGLILAVIAVQFVINGAGEAVHSFLAGLEGAAGAD